jgi:hypothetical protein
VLELFETRAAVVGAFAASEALDALRPAGAHRCRVASDEAMFVGPPGAGEQLLRDSAAVTAGDADAIVLDVADGWAVWTLSGEEAPAAFARLSRFPSDDGFVQGDVAGVPTRVIVERGRIHLLVPATSRDQMRARILDRCPGISERSEPASWGVGTHP